MLYPLWRLIQNETGAPKWLCNDNWFPGDAHLVGKNKGPMKTSIIVNVIKNINAHDRRFVDKDQSIGLNLDGHKSR